MPLFCHCELKTTQTRTLSGTDPQGGHTGWSESRVKARHYEAVEVDNSLGRSTITPCLPESFILYIPISRAVSLDYLILLFAKKMMKNKVQDIIYIIFVVINVILFIIGIYDKTKNILLYEYKDTLSSTRWKIDKLFDEENDKDMLSNVNVTVTSNKRHRQESSHLRQRETKKKHKKERRKV